MPLHPADRPLSETLREDREAFILADELGYSEAYMGEAIRIPKSSERSWPPFPRG